MCNRPIVSLVVPTKNRYQYLKQLIALVNDFHLGGKLELVIQDNSDNNIEIKTFLDEYKFSFVKYFYTKENLSVAANSDLAIRNSSGEYVSFIGDDDGVTKYIVDCCSWMKANEIECVVPKGYSFQWSDAISSTKILNSAGSLKYRRPNNKITIETTQGALNKLLDSGCTKRDFIPLLYHGVVKRSVLERVWDKCNSYFPGASPDMANGVALSLVMEKFAFVTFPVVFSGVSKFVGGGARGMKHRAETDFSKLPFLPANISEIWNKRVPKIWTGASIWCESAIQSFTAMGREDYIDKINFEFLYAYFASRYTYYKSMAYELSSNKLVMFIRSSLLLFKRYINAAFRLFNKKLFGNRISGASKTQKNIKNISQCVDFLNLLIEENKVNPFLMSE